MSSLNKKSMNLIAIGGVAAVVVFAAGYFALSAYASTKAEERIREYMIENGTPNALSWSSVSSSPLGGTVTIHDALWNHETKGWSGKVQQRMSVKELRLTGFATSDPYPLDARIVMEQVEFPSLDIGQGELNGLRKQYSQSPLMDLALTSGRSELPPFDVDIGWKVQNESTRVEWQFRQPEMFQAKGVQEVRGAIDKNLDEVSVEALTRNPLGLMLMAGGELGLSRFEIEVQDDGAFKRINQLNDRYAVARRTYDKEKDARKAAMQRHEKECREEMGEVWSNDDACQRFARFMTADQSSLKLKAGGDKPLTFADFEKGGLAMVKLRLKPQLN